MKWNSKIERHPLQRRRPMHFALSLAAAGMIAVTSVASGASLTLKTRVTVQDVMAPVSSASVACEIYDAPQGASIANMGTGLGSQGNTAARGVIGSGVAANLPLPMSSQEVRVRINVASVAELARARSYQCNLFLGDSASNRTPIAAGAQAAPADQPYQAETGKPFSPSVSGNF